MNKLVTVIIPSYNHSKFISATIESVIAQTYEKIELIIIDDGSKDKSIQIIESFREVCERRFINFKLVSRPNRGLCATLNEALSYSSGEYVAIIASDDFMYPLKTMLQVEYLDQHNDCVGVFSGATIIKENGDCLVQRSGTLKKYFFKDIILNNYQLFSPSGMYRAKLLNEVGGYNENVLLEDWFMNLSITEQGGYLFPLQSTLIAYRRHENNASNRTLALHSDREKILQLFQHSKYILDARNALDYTIAYESVTFNKCRSIKYLYKSIVRNPKLLFYRNTIVTFIKICIPKAILNKRTHGR